MLVEADAAIESIEMTRAEPRGVIRLSCPTMLLEFRVAEMVAEYMRQFPEVQVHLLASNRLVGHGLDFYTVRSFRRNAPEGLAAIFLFSWRRPK